MEYTVYKHTCPNGKIYIGITSMPVEKRWDCGRGYAKNPHFSAAIKKCIKFTDAHRAALRDAALQREEKRRQARCLTIEK